MYEDEQLADMRFHISRDLEAVRRMGESTEGDKSKLQDVYDALDHQRAHLGTIVWEIPSHSLYNATYTTAYNDVDQAAEQLSYAMGDNEDERPHHLANMAQFLTEAVTALTS